MTTTLRFFHGTSTATGLEDGDYMDPTRGAFEPCVWGSSTLAHAQRFARDTAATLGGEAVVFALNLGSANIKTVEIVDDINDALDTAREEGFDALIIEKGENGAPEIAILTKRSIYAETI
jgi:hypothetical protein